MTNPASTGNGQTHSLRNGVIIDAQLISEGGVIAGSIKIDYGNGKQQAFGNYALYRPSGTEGFAGQANLAGQFISGVMRVAGVNTWADLKGKAVRVLGNDEKIDALGHIVADDWFHPANALAQMIKANNEHFAAQVPSHDDLLRDLRAHLVKPYVAADSKKRRTDGKMLANRIAAVLGEVTDVEPVAA